MRLDVVLLLLYHVPEGELISVCVAQQREHASGKRRLLIAVHGRHGTSPLHHEAFFTLLLFARYRHFSWFRLFLCVFLRFLHPQHASRLLQHVHFAALYCIAKAVPSAAPS
jgi:hypothetical protein